ncbi:MAG: hypothetical protein JXK07_15640 [Spirochaetes bacterium]|nr:hypothetical protein [Spirochaetota bacterium]MBN2769606.1 hypothetical protein [Spirochaetota bacterium]
MNTTEKIEIYDYDSDKLISEFDENSSIELYSESGKHINSNELNHDTFTVKTSEPIQNETLDNDHYVKQNLSEQSAIEGEISINKNNTTPGTEATTVNSNIKPVFAPSHDKEPRILPLPRLMIRADKIAHAIINHKELDASFFIAPDETPLTQDEIFEIVNQAEKLEFIECEGIGNNNDECFSNIYTENISQEVKNASKFESNSLKNKKKQNLYYSSHFIEKPDFNALPKPGLSEIERASIEEDIFTEHSLVIEESIEDIKQKLLEYWYMQCEQCEDISDTIVILENDSDVERFINNFPDIAKKEKLKTLLEYFGNLFEKLPEDTLNSFAKSEYFDMYIDFMNQLQKN